MPLTEEEILAALMRWRTRLSAAAWLVVRDAHAAEDIFQNVAVKAMTREARFEAEGALVSWAFITARREGIDWLRRHRREVVTPEADILDLLDAEFQSVPSPARGGRLEALESCLEAVPESSRRLLRLRYFDGRSCEEVAAELGVGLDAVYKRVSRLHEALRDCVNGRLRGAWAGGGGTR